MCVPFLCCRKWIRLLKASTAAIASKSKDPGTLLTYFQGASTTEVPRSLTADILCEHGGLVRDAKARRRVSEAAWRFFRTQYDGNEMPVGATPLQRV